MNSNQKGNKRTRMRLAVLGVLLAGGAIATVQAETLPGTMLFQSTTMVTSANINMTELDLSTPGTLYVSLSDLGWPNALSSLNFSLFDAMHAVTGTATSYGWSYDITSPSTLFGAVFATPDAAAKAGLYNVQINFQSSVAPVPLPAAGWFLLSGIAGLAALRPKQKLSQTFA